MGLTPLAVPPSVGATEVRVGGSESPIPGVAAAGSAAAERATADQRSTEASALAPAGDRSERSSAGEERRPGDPGDRRGSAANAVSPSPAGGASPATAAASTAVPASPTNPVATAAAAAAAAGARLDQAAETVEAVVRIAAQRGITHARLALRPRELGGIEIRLLANEAGLVARVVADTPQAAQALERAAADLRRTLESQGVNLLSLDIGQSGAEDATGFGSAGAEPGTGAGPATSGTSTEADYPGQSDVESTIELPNGVLVDVLA